MSEEDEPCSEGFTNSENDWKPELVNKGGESSDDDDSDFVIDPAAHAKTAHGSRNRHRSVSKGAMAKKKKTNSQSVRSKYLAKPEQNVNLSSNSPSASTSTSRSTSKATRLSTKNPTSQSNYHKLDNDDNNDDDDDKTLNGKAKQSTDKPVKQTQVEKQLKTRNASRSELINTNFKIRTKSSDSGSEDDNESSTEDHHGAQHIARLNSNHLEHLFNNINSKLEKLKLNEMTKDNDREMDIPKDYGKQGPNDCVSTDSQTSKLEENKLQMQMGTSKLMKTKSTRIKRHTKTRPTSAVIKTAATHGGSDSDEDDDFHYDEAGRRRKN